MIKIVSIHEASFKGEKRYLVERSWPKGLHRAESKLTAWLKDLAPSRALWVWFHHDPDKEEAFRRSYYQELRQKEGVWPLLQAMRKGDVTLVVSGQPRLSHARWLKDFLKAEAPVTRLPHEHLKLEHKLNTGVQPPPSKYFQHKENILGLGFKKTRMHDSQTQDVRRRSGRQKSTRSFTLGKKR
jgi:uncharacterized protein YeaO (DUF488 family)